MPAPGTPDPKGAKDEDLENEDPTGADDGDESGATDASKDGTGDDKPKPKAGQERTFTQAEVDTLFQKRVAKLEPKAKKWDEHVASQQSEAEKAATAQAERDQKAAERETRANAKLIIAEIKLQIAGQGVDPEFQDLVEAAVAQADTIDVDDEGTVTGVEEAIKRLLTEKPKLKAADPKAPPGKSGGEFKGNDGKTAAQRLADVESQREQARLKGDAPATRNAVLEGIRLKLAGRK
jgi:hypothetical protein